MTWEQKLQAIMAIKPGIGVTMRKPGDWYVSGGHFARRAEGKLNKGIVGNGLTPESAVNALWIELANGEPFEPTFGAETWKRWNGFMWEEAPTL